MGTSELMLTNLLPAAGLSLRHRSVSYKQSERPISLSSSSSPSPFPSPSYNKVHKFVLASTLAPLLKMLMTKHILSLSLCGRPTLTIVTFLNISWLSLFSFSHKTDINFSVVPIVCTFSLLYIVLFIQTWGVRKTTLIIRTAAHSHG